MSFIVVGVLSMRQLFLWVTGQIAGFVAFKEEPSSPLQPLLLRYSQQQGQASEVEC